MSPSGIMFGSIVSLTQVTLVVCKCVPSWRVSDLLGEVGFDTRDIAHGDTFYHHIPPFIPHPRDA